MGDVTDLEGFAKRVEREQQLVATNRDLLRRLEKAKASKEELVEALYRAGREAISLLEIPEIPAPHLNGGKSTPEVAVAVLSDWQLAKVTTSYSSEVCEQRIQKYADKVVSITEVQRADHPVSECRVWLLGDLVEGELIFPGQSHQTDSSLYKQVMVDGPRILTTFLRTMLANFEHVHVAGVIGNHGALGGRARKDYNPETNADRMLYRLIQHLFEGEERITFEIPEGPHQRNWYAIDDIGGYKTLLFHGDQIRGGFAGFPWYGFAKKIWGWRTGAIPEEFDAAICGHWHQPTTMSLNHLLVRVSGSTESDNPYAQELLAATGRPSQRLLFVRPGWDVTGDYIVWLDEEAGDRTLTVVE